MSSHIILVEHQNDWLPEYPQAEVLTAKDYLSGVDLTKYKGARVINLCRNYRYLSTGYYCSLLGEARRHKMVPSVRTITDLSSRLIYSLDIGDLNNMVQKSLKTSAMGHDVSGFEVDIFFGHCVVKELQELARQIFDMFRCPLLRAEFRRQGNWQIASIKALHLNGIRPEQRAFFSETLSAYLSKRWQGPRSKIVSRYDLAVLFNPEEVLPPSSQVTLRKFIRAGKKMDVNVELIEKKDYSKLAEYDALFIRETTRIDHYTYRFSKKAESEGMVVIDDPDSIVECTNKIYLKELMSTHKIPVPKSQVLLKGGQGDFGAELGYPLVLKIPDGSFSRGVFKASDPRQAQEIAERLFKESDLILAQEYLYTDFDWRVGILNRKPIFVCQYFMTKDHWQIVKHGTSGRPSQGNAKTFRVEDAPADVVNVAVKAANLIGDGLYGVDVKQTDKGIFVIEVNDNPNIDHRVEDACLGDELYDIVIEDFVRRLNAKRGRG